MKKFLAIMLVLVMVMALAACGNQGGDTTPSTSQNTTPDPTPSSEATEPSSEPSEPTVSLMTHAEYMAADMDAAVCVEFYVQDAQGWWFDSEAGHGKLTVYGQDNDGGYFVYEMNISEEDAAKLVPGTKIRVTGYKTAWSGEVEIVDATCEIIEGDTYVADALDVTALLGTEELIAHQNEKVLFKGMTVESITFKNDGGDDIYVALNYNGNTYNFCVEMYLTGPDTEVYQTVSALQPGDVVDIEGFLYWYEGPNTHITAVTVPMTHAEYMAADMDAAVCVEFYVQDAQGWWFDNDAGHGKLTVYGQDNDGGYFVYEMNISEEDAAKLVPGTKIRVTGYKTAWSGEVEVVDATCQIIEGDTYVADALDVTALLGTEELIAHQNEKVLFKGMTVESITFKNDGGDDIYVALNYNGNTYNFCVEMYLTGPDTEVYQTVSALQPGDVVDIEGFLYWYEGPNTHITAVTPAA